EIERAGLQVRTKLLNQPSVFRFYANGQRVGRELHHRTAKRMNCPHAYQTRSPGLATRPGSLYQRTVVWDRLRLAVYDGHNAQAHGRGADRGYDDLHRLSCNANRSLLALQRLRVEQRGDAR